ncbi:hypothetical protein [Rathayibacter festucae]|uniref:Uncharacterized protein n=1 Tax=Rathayibacter festucae DSM 15932 TaxID=1328866 RepID=A0A3T0SYP3_9MICO|nr:hypothetical protein [Rathayibacter festucae]AZZ51409.1 hypothetical protein C1I64_04705 [Rathayibacter festucae DSM 15932]
MEEQGTWKISKKEKGSKQVHYSDRYDPVLRAALQTLADRETQRTGTKISVSTVIANLTTRNGSFAIEKRKEIRQILRTLKKENTHG